MNEYKPANFREEERGKSPKEEEKSRRESSGEKDGKKGKAKAPSYIFDKTPTQAPIPDDSNTTMVLFFPNLKLQYYKIVLKSILMLYAV